MSHGYILLARGVLAPASGSSDQSPPASGATVTLWSSATNQNSTFGGARFKRLIVNMYSSHVGGTNGLSFEESNDGVTWDQVVAYTVAATTYTKNTVSLSAPFVRVMFTNSANTLTTYRMSVLGDVHERVA